MVFLSSSWVWFGCRGSVFACFLGYPNGTGRMLKQSELQLRYRRQIGRMSTQSLPRDGMLRTWAVRYSPFVTDDGSRAPAVDLPHSSSNAGAVERIPVAGSVSGSVFVWRSSSSFSGHSSHPDCWRSLGLSVQEVWLREFDELGKQHLFTWSRSSVSWCDTMETACN